MRTIPGLLLLSAVLAPVSLLPAPGRQLTPPIASSGHEPLPAGTREGDLVTVRLVARPARWAPDEQDTPPLTVYAFAEEGQSPGVPGPLIRVRQGTRIRVQLRNALEHTLYVRGLQSRPATVEDTLRVPSGETREATFDAGAPGTYLYWASADSAVDSLGKREAEDSQLNGVIVVDETDLPAPDYLFVITTTYIPPDTTAPVEIPERFIVAVNGRHWPHTERLAHAVGDSVRWRWVNASFEPHPMHLHGFFFRITRSGTMLADTLLPPDLSRMAVTETFAEGETREILWVPERPGNWLAHCHLQVHVDPASTRYLPPGTVERRHRGNHAQDAMRGLAWGVSVTGRSGMGKATIPEQRRVLRMDLSRLTAGGRSRVAVGLSDDATGLTGTPRSPGAALVLRRGEPTRIWVVNRLEEPSTIHWHGLELDSYFDGVAGFSGERRRLAPLIAPGDSFAVDITPHRPGTYIYHSHMEDTNQRGDGLYGPLIVLDSAERWDAAHNPIFIVGGREIEDTLPPLLNGSVAPEPLNLVEGDAYRLRLINVMENNTLVLGVARGGAPAVWRAVARDAAPLPAGLAVSGPARVRTEVGMTFDYQFVPQRGEYQFEVRRRAGRLMNTQRLRVAAVRRGD